MNDEDKQYVNDKVKHAIDIGNERWQILVNPTIMALEKQVDSLLQRISELETKINS